MRLALRYGDKERDIPNSKYICSTLNRPTLKGGELPRNRRAPSLRVPPESVRQGDVADDDGSPTIGQGGTGTTSCGSRGPPKASERRGGGGRETELPSVQVLYGRHRHEVQDDAPPGTQGWVWVWEATSPVVKDLALEKSLRVIYSVEYDPSRVFKGCAED